MLDLFLKTRELLKEAQAPTANAPIVPAMAPPVESQTNAMQQRTTPIISKPTAGQLARWGTLGATAGMGSLALTNLMEGAGKTKTWLPNFDVPGLLGPAGNKVVRGGLEKQVILHPRALARAATIGMLFSTAVPAMRLMWDRRTAEKTPEKF